MSRDQPYPRAAQTEGRPRVVVVVQARSSSSRLPGKVLLDLGGRTMLERMLERLAHARTPDAVIVATTTEPVDDAIEAVAGGARVPCFRGHASDLLDRHLQAALRFDADVVVKIPSDCPLVDPAVVDRVIGAHLEAPGAVDYTSNLHPESYPDGSDVEAMTVAALRTAWQEARLPHQREHTTPFFWEHPERFVLQNVAWETGRDASRTHRVVVDYAEDYEVVRAVFDALWTPAGPVFSVADVTAHLDAHPSVRRRNERHFGVSWQTLRQRDRRLGGGPDARAAAAKED